MSDNHHHRCPAWVAKLLASPLRRLAENPERILGPHVSPGMAVLEPGPGLGFFTLPMARMVGPEGRVVALEVQQSLRDGLERRVRKAGLADRVDCVLCDAGSATASKNGDGPDLAESSVDFCPVINVLHELDDAGAFLALVLRVLRPGGRMLLMEPRGHVSEADFQSAMAHAEQAGFTVLEQGTDTARRQALLARPEQA